METPKFNNKDNSADVELTPEQKEKFTRDLDTFWKNSGALAGLYDTSKITFIPEWIRQGDINLNDFQESARSEESFTYLTNQETALLNYESLGEPEIFNPDTDQDLNNWIAQQENKGMTVKSVTEYLHEKFKDTHYLPGIEYEKYLYENTDKIPEKLKDGNHYYFVGSVLAKYGGNLHVPDGVWKHGRWSHKGTGALSSAHNSNFVMFRK